MGGQVNKGPLVVPAGVTIRLMGKKLYAILLLGAVSMSGCGSVGPEVRLSPDALSWKPALVAMLPAIASGDAIPAGTVLPEGEVRPTAPEALTEVSAPLASAFRERSNARIIQLIFTQTEAGQRAEKAARQYLESRIVDPALTAKLGADTSADAVLLVALLRYGPEVDEVQQMSQSAQTRMGTSQVNISSTASRTVLYYNVQFRCVLIRCADGAMLWDAGVRKREKRLSVLNITQASVLTAAINELVDSFPYARPRPEAAKPR